MVETIGHSVSMSLGRRVVRDFLEVSMNMPLVSIQRDMNLAELVAARQQARPRPSWCSIFTKAYAKVVAHRPELRRVYLSFPWERLFEYREATADVVVESVLGSENVVVSVPVKRPDTCSLLEIDAILAAGKENPVARCRRYQRALFLARFPRCVRKWVWWWLLNVSGHKRARYFGTFGVSSVANFGVDSLCPISPWTTILHYGTFDQHGNIAMRLTLDHRVLDGAIPSRALTDMEEVLNTNMVAELRGLSARPRVQELVSVS